MLDIGASGYDGRSPWRLRHLYLTTGVVPGVVHLRVIALTDITFDAAHSAPPANVRARFCALDAQRLDEVDDRTIGGT